MAADWLAVAYLALAAGALTMVAQTWAQARMDPTRAAVIMAMEPVWAAGFAVAFGGEVVTVRLVIGGLAILAAIYLAELGPRTVPHQVTPTTPPEPTADSRVTWEPGTEPAKLVGTATVSGDPENCSPASR